MGELVRTLDWSQNPLGPTSGWSQALRTAVEIVLQSPWEAESMTIADLLMSQHRWGRTRCRRFLATIPMPENKTIGSMTERQRHALAAMLEAGTPQPAPLERSGPAQPALAGVL